MASLSISYSARPEAVRFEVYEKSLVGKPRPVPLAEWSDRVTSGRLNSIYQLLNWVDEEDAGVDEFGIEVSHERISELSGIEAAGLGLPSPPPYVLEVRSQGAIGFEDFDVSAVWLSESNQPVPGIGRTGAILRVGSREYRIPAVLFDLVERIEKFSNPKETDSAERLKAWADVQEALLVQGVEGVRPDQHLSTIRVMHASAFSLSLTTEGGRFDFDPVLFGPNTSSNTDVEDLEDEGSVELVSEAAQLLPPKQQKYFASDRFFTSDRDRYALKDGWVVVLDEPVREALRVVRSAKDADDETKREFVRNPRTFLRQAMGDEADDESLERVFIETSEYSRRVLDVGIWQPPVLPWVKRTADKWLPEEFGLRVGDKTIFIPQDEIPNIRTKIEDAISASSPTIEWNGESIPATRDTLIALDGLEKELSADRNDSTDHETVDEESVDGPTVLVIEDYLDDGAPGRLIAPRAGGSSTLVPSKVRSTLKNHQEIGLRWLQNAWRAGQQGVLLADDMGLGKTLQALSFLAWLQEGMNQRTLRRAPLLVVAPTGLLKNWEQENSIHLSDGGLGEPVRAYNPFLRDLREGDGRGKDVDLGRASLRIDEIQRASWVLTTYETLRDYQLSFGTVRFAAIVFDEIQKTKTPGSLITNAAKAMNANFAVGMTGTPIENRLADLWCIVDTLEPGLLADLKSFSAKYEKDEDPEALQELKSLLCEPRDGVEPVMLRRMKSGQLDSLPSKTIHIKQNFMPEVQESAYSDAIVSAKHERAPGRMLKALQQLRSISLHPYHPEQGEYPSYIDDSARLRTLFEVLDEIQSKQEKALVFLESLEMQPILAGFIRRRYALPNQPMIISGSVEGRKRQERVNQFQSEDRKGFDVMILSPRAGGVGLTLTAANHVIHLSRWWNPAVEDQCTDRVYRIGQEKPVHVYVLQALHPELPAHSFDERIHELLERKRSLSQDMLIPPVNKDRDAQDLYEGTVVHKEPANDGRSDVDQARFEVDTELTPEDIDCLEPVEFERWVIRRLRQLGLRAQPTQRSWDGGADAIGEIPESGLEFIIQCKHTQSRGSMDKSPIEDLARARESYDKPDARLFAVTNAPSYTPEATAMAQEIGATLVSRDQLFTWRPE